MLVEYLKFNAPVIVW